MTKMATIISLALARASASMMSLPSPRSAPMNSPTMTPISANYTAGSSDANTQASAEGITTVRSTVNSLAPSRRAAAI